MLENSAVELGWGFVCDILKAEEGHVRGERVRYVSGVASEESTDQQGEVLVHKGIDFGPLLLRGYINYDHLDVRGAGSPDALIGIPTHAEIGKSARGVPNFSIEGYLFNDPVNKPMADAAWRHLQALAATKSYGSGPGRRMGWSIQGRSSMKVGGKILKSVITDVAMTHKPVHLATDVEFAEVVKSLGDAVSGASTRNLAPTMREDLRNADGTKSRGSGGRRRVEDAMHAIYGGPEECKCGHVDRATGMFKSEAGAMEHLCKCLGYGSAEAQGFTSVMKSAWKF